MASTEEKSFKCRNQAIARDLFIVDISAGVGLLVCVLEI